MDVLWTFLQELKELPGLCNYELKFRNLTLPNQPNRLGSTLKVIRILLNIYISRKILV